MTTRTESEGSRPAAKEPGDVILQVRDLRTWFYTRAGIVKAVDGIDFDLRQGETLGIVGESGCGKSMTARSLLRLVPKPAGRIVSGQILLEGEDLVLKSEEEMRQVRGKRISMILQDPQTSLNPLYTIGNQLREALGQTHRESSQSMVRRAIDALRSVNVAAPERRLHDYPHQMSGGMKQRVVGAIAISCEPSGHHCRRADYGLGRHHSATVSEAAQGNPGKHRLGDYLYHPRLWGGGPDVRSGGGDVRRAHCGTGPGAGHFQQSFPSVYRGVDSVGTEAGGAGGMAVFH